MPGNDQALNQSLQPLLEYLDAVPSTGWQELGSRLERVIEAAVPVLGVDGAGLMLLDEADRPRVAGVSDELGLRLEAAQTQSGQGPGIDSLRTGASVTVTDLAADGRYPQTRAQLSPPGGCGRCCRHRCAPGGRWWVTSTLCCAIPTPGQPSRCEPLRRTRTSSAWH